MTAGRRVIFRWAWRRLRAEWRSQALVLALLVLAVAAAVALASGAWNTAAAPDAARFGSATHMLRLGGADASALRADVAAARRVADVDALLHWSAPVPGAIRRVRYRAQDPRGRFAAPLLALREGRLPARPGEVAVTDRVAVAFDVVPGSTLAADGTPRTVVGTVENPANLDDEFALVTPGDAPAPESATLLSAAPLDRLDTRSPDREVGARAAGTRAAAAAAVLAVTALALLLVGLVAAAGFAVLAQRRLRQLGLLAAIGATERQLRLVVVAHGALLGVTAAAIGSVLGLAAWVALEPRLEVAAGHRIDVLAVPWWLVSAAGALAVAAATAAAWWPARTAARVPVVLALSGRPPRPRPVRGSAARAALLLAAGVAAIALAGGANAPLLAAGALAVAGGCLLAGPAAILALARAGTRAPVAVRLALRDLARHRARSAVALAAISLALGVPAAVVVGAAAAEHGAAEGNLPADTLLVRPGDPDDPSAPCPGEVQVGEAGGPCPFLPLRSAAATERLEAGIARIATALGGATAEPFAVAYDASAPAAAAGRPVATLGRDAADLGLADAGPGLVDASLLYVATPELLDLYGATAAPGTEILTVERGDLWWSGLPRPAEPMSGTVALERRHSSLPGTLITEAAMRRRGLAAGHAGWLLQARGPIAERQADAARRVAATAGLLVEARDPQASLATLRTRATAAGLILALAILAMTIGLLRGEARADLAR